MPSSVYEKCTLTLLTHHVCRFATMMLLNDLESLGGLEQVLEAASLDVPKP